MTIKVGAVGPAGSMSGAVAKQFFLGSDYELSYFKSLDLLQEAFYDEMIDISILPANHSVSGPLKSKSTHQSYLNSFIKKASTHHRLNIVGEAFLPINFSLMAREGVEEKNIVEINVNPTGVESCAEYLEKDPRQKWRIAKHDSSSAAAAALNIEKEGVDPMTRAALATPDAADSHHLHILQRDVVNNPAMMHFFVLSNTPSVNLPHTYEQTLIDAYVATIAHLDYVNQLKERGLVLNRYILDDESVYFEVSQESSQLLSETEAECLEVAHKISSFPACLSRQVQQRYESMSEKPAIPSAGLTGFSIFPPQAVPIDLVAENQSNRPPL